MESFIKFDGEDNIGGIASFQIADIADISSITGNVVSFYTGKGWGNGYASQGSLSLAETMKQTASGTQYAKTIKGVYPKGSDEMLSIFSSMANGRRFMVKITDNNGVQRLVGRMGVPLMFEFNYATGGPAAQMNGYTFTFYSIDAIPSPQID